jgi:hypothetical protein
MKRYWDLTTKQKAALTDDELESLMRVELMENGNLVPEPPKLEEVKPEDFERSTYYAIKCDGCVTLDVLFDNVERATSFLALKPLRRGSSWQRGADHACTVEHASISPEQLPSEDTLAANQSLVTENAHIKSRNAAATSAYRKACDELAEHKKELLADYRNALASERDAERIRKTFEEYKAMCDGDEDVARRFLAKAFSAECIEAALKDD